MDKLRIGVKKEVIWSFFFIILYRIALDLSYYLMICKFWRYAKFELKFNSIKFIESYLFLFIIFIFMPKSSKKLSNVMIWLLTLLIYIPMISFYALSDESRIFIYGATCSWLMVLLLLHLPNVSLPFLKQAGIIRFSLFILLVLIVFFMIYMQFGLSFNFDLKKVYEIRSEYVGMKIPLAGYLFSWVAKVVNPLFFAFFIVKKKWYFVAFIFVLQILLFSNTGIRNYLFALPFVLILMWIMARKNPLGYMAIGLVGIIVLGILSYWLINDKWITSLFTRRLLFVPAQLNFLYYDYFSQNGFVFLSYHRMFQLFSDYPFHLAPPHLIAEAYFNKPQMNSNIGLFGDAYMNFGFVGLALWGIFLVIILKLVDTFSKRKDIKITVAAIAMPTLALRSSALLTNIFTQGLFLVLILLYLLPKETIKTNIKS